MTDLIIIGTGDHARVALETARADGRLVRHLVEPSDRAADDSIDGVPVVRGLARLDEMAPGWEFIVAVGANRTRAELFARAEAAGGRAAILVHPTATLLAGAEVGPGSHVCAGAIVGIEARIGRNVIVNTAAVLDHDAIIGDHAFLAPRSVLAGRVTVGSGAHVGLGAVVIEGRTIGAWSLVAAGATVIRDVAPSTRVAGTPARPMETQDG